MNEIRCASCRRLLLKSADRAIVGPVDIKCPRCGTMNSLRPLVIDPTEPVSERPERRDNEALNVIRRTLR
ncbi:Com family DNA-binding transcriptional regulator [Roseibium algae]|uniref:Com family DNA-binding transcriptional regulator n=1 Tax=Roseibium algae TaxID=3123038 RepID=UPI003BF60EA7